MSHQRPGYPAQEAEALATAIKKRIRGEVRFDPGSRALYATDGSNYRQVPIGVVIHSSTKFGGFANRASPPPPMCPA